MKNVFLFLIAIAFFSCNNREIQEIKDPITGKVVEQYQVIETKDGSIFKDGTYKKWFSNGQIEQNGFYQDNKRTGEWKTYYENGQLNSILNLENDSLNGGTVGFYENGSKKFEGIFEKDKLQGKWLEWHETGSVYKEEFYVDGLKDGLQIDYFENGNKEFETNYSNGKLHGKSTLYHENGNKMGEGEFTDGQQDYISWTYWDENGKEWLNKTELIIGAWHNGDDSHRVFSEDGSCLIVYENGKEQEITYKVTEKALTLYFGFLSSGTYSFVDFDRNKFTIKDSKGKSWTYTRLNL